MKRAIDGILAKRIDSYSIENGMPSLVLMERAAMKTAEYTAELMGTGGTACALFVCSMGNNGADGLAAARMLAMDGKECHVLLIGNSEHATPEFNVQLRLVKHLCIPVYFFDEDIHGKFFDEYTVIVDALFGIGLSRDIEGAYTRVVELINTSGKKVVSVDIPSGINSANGQVMGAAVHADITVTFGYAKLGELLYPGKSFTGELHVENIGFLPEYVKTQGTGVSALYFESSTDFGKYILKRPARSNKGNYGKPLIIAGSKDMTGAAFMSGLAAYRTGAGVVTVLTHESADAYLKSMLPEAIVKSRRRFWRVRLRQRALLSSDRECRLMNCPKELQPMCFHMQRFRLLLMQMLLILYRRTLMNGWQGNGQEAGLFRLLSHLMWVR